MEGTRMYDVEQLEDWPVNPWAIYTLRLEAKLTQLQLAVFADVGISTLCAWENARTSDEHRPRISTVLKLARALSDKLGREVDPADLLKPRKPQSAAVAS
jgi:transcriptional regulator with XRE-family HTH domain